MTTFTRQPDKSLAVLGLMRDLAERGHGYVAVGVGGWARAGDVNVLLEIFYYAQRYTGVAGDELRLGYSNRGYYDRIDVRVQGAQSSVMMYRVREAAARMLNERDKREHVPIAPAAEAKDGGVWMPATAPIALQELILAADNPIQHEPFRDARGFRTPLQLSNALKKAIRERLEARDKAGEPEVVGERKPQIIQPGDFRWLAAAGFAEERRGEGRQVFFRVTPAGRAARALVWHGPAPAFMNRPD